MDKKRQIALTLGEIRPLLDSIARYSICMQETGDYENYRFLKDVPEDYDSLFIYGIGLIETEFDGSDGLEFLHAIEIVLSKEPRDD